MNPEYFKPTLADIPSMQDLVEEDVQTGIILQRTSSEMATTIRSYICVKVDNKLAGFVALHVYNTKLAEIRSLNVSSKHRGKLIGSQLIKLAIKEARKLHLKQIIVLTYQTNMFLKLDFVQIEKESIPENKIWTDCIKCKHFPVCNEIALSIDI